MRTEKIKSQSFDSLKDGLLNLLQNKSYGNDTISNYRRKLNQLERYMSANKIVSYTPSAGQQFIDDYLTSHALSKSNRQFMHTVIRRLDDFSIGDYRLQSKADRAPLTQSHTVLLEAYLQKCRTDGNRESTIWGKESFLREFLSYLTALGCHDIRNADATIIGRACLMQGNRDGWAVIKMFLRQLNYSNLIDYDFSAIVPRFRRACYLPSVYTEAEIKRFEDAIDTTTKTGRRNYAMLLLAARLGMRSGDIANLAFSALDFENGTINILQEKTDEPLCLPMLPVVINAMADYLENGRPKSILQYVFLRAVAPYGKITTSVIRSETSKYFGMANINISGKRHGPHVFRSSLASSMINHMTPYDVVRKTLGHTDPDAVKHYAKVDIERLREYAIEPPAPSGCFETFLEGRRL